MNHTQRLQMSFRKPKTFTVDQYTVTVDTEDWPRVQPLVRLMRAATPGPVFLINHGTVNRPVYQPLAQFIMQDSGYCVLRDRTAPGLHTKSNLVRQ
jgi:hypothetical protein